MNKENEILEAAHDAVLERPIPFNITVTPQNAWHKFLMWLKIRPRVLKLSFEPTNLGARVWYSKYLVGVNLSSEDLKESHVSLNHNATIAYTERMAKAMAAAINNRDSEPPQWLVKAILNDVSALEFKALTAIMEKFIDPTAFLESIISLTGMSLNEQEEIIASTRTHGE
jgi:hypothetical protein